MLQGVRTHSSMGQRMLYRVDDDSRPRGRQYSYNTLQDERDSCQTVTKNTWLLNKPAFIFTVLNCIIHLRIRAHLGLTRQNGLPVWLQSGGSLLLPKQLHTNLQCEMRIRRLISQEESVLLHPKVVEVVLSLSDLECPFPTLPSHWSTKPDRPPIGVDIKGLLCSPTSLSP